MKSIKALFLFTLIWSTVVYFQLKKKTLGSSENPVKLWVLANKEKAVYFRARELVSNLKNETGLNYQWKVVFSKKEAIESLNLSRIDVLLNLEGPNLKVMKPGMAEKKVERGRAQDAFDRNPASVKRIGQEDSIEVVKFRKALPKRINYTILRGLKKQEQAFRN